MKYKRLVRDTLGSASRQYQGLRVRNGHADDADDAEGAEEAPAEEITTPAPEVVTEAAPAPSVA